MADNRLFSPPGVVAMGNALSSRISRPNLYDLIVLIYSLPHACEVTRNLARYWAPRLREITMLKRSIMKINIKKASVKFREDLLYFQHFMLIFVFAPN